MKNTPFATLLKWTRGAFFLNAAVWLVLGILSLSLAIQGGSDLRWIYTALMVANSVVMFVFGLVLGLHNHVFTLAIPYMTFNAVLSITDQFGVIDALVLCLSLVVLGLLVLTRVRMPQAVGTPPRI